MGWQEPSTENEQIQDRTYAKHNENKDDHKKSLSSLPVHTGRAPDQSPLRHLIIAVIVVDYVSGKTGNRVINATFQKLSTKLPTLSEGCQCVQSPCCRRRLQGRSCRSSCRSPPRSLRSGSTAPRRGRCQRRLLRGGPLQGAEDEKTS